MKHLSDRSSPDFQYGLPSFETLMINARKSDAARWNASSNALEKSLLVV